MSDRPRRRVLFVLPSFAAGGAERVMLTLLSRLDRARFEPALLTLSEEGPLRGMVPDDIDARCVDSARLRAALPSLRRAITEARPDLVLSTMAYLNFAILMLGPSGPRYFVREANMPDHTARQIGSVLLARLFYRLAYRRAAAVLCNARPMADALAKWGVDREKLVMMSNPVDVDALRADARIDAAPAPGRRFVAAGRLIAQKGFDRLIDWFVEMPLEDRLSILGDGPLRAALQAQIRTRGLEGRVVLAGFDARPADRIAGADAVLLPSRWEGMPNVALEALALGAPVIAHSEAGGVRDLAAMAPPGAIQVAEDGEAFAAAMHKVEPMPDRRLRPSLLPAEYEVAAVVRRYEELFEG